MLLTGCPWFTNTGVFVDTQRTQSSYQAMYYAEYYDDDGHKRGPTSRHVVGTEIQRDCNFEAHSFHFSYRLGCMYSRWFILLSHLPYRPLVPHHNYTIWSGLLCRGVDLFWHVLFLL